jgi:pilus assembly protein CpaE
MCFLGEDGARRRVDKRSVCLIDLDIQFGTTALALDLVPNDGLLEIIRTPSRLDGALLRGASVTHPSGLHVLTAPRSSVPLDALTPSVLVRLLEVARQEFEYVVVDTPAALTSWTEPLLGLSDTVYVVTQLSVAALGQTRRFLDSLEEEGHYGLPLRMVLNRYRKRLGDTLDIRQAEKALNRKVDHIVPNDFELVTKAVNQGVPVYSVKRRSRIGDGIISMVAEPLKKPATGNQLAAHA